MKKRMVILDRDGTINVERHYLSDPAQVELLPKTAEGLRKMRDLGLGLVVVTNQSGLARGYFDETTLAAVHDRLEALLEAEGVRLDGIYYCPHLPEDDCDCRKPKTGLVTRAARKLGFDPADCFVIGDKACDLDLGRAVKAVTILVRTGYGAREEANGPDTDHVADDLSQAAEYIAERLQAETPEGGPA